MMMGWGRKGSERVTLYNVSSGVGVGYGKFVGVWLSFLAWFRLE